MIRKILLCVFGFGLGIFMLFNSIVALNRFLHGYEKPLEPFEWMFSSVITFSTGVVLLVWTYLLVKKPF